MHPSDEDLLPGTPERKMPLCCVVSVEIWIENAVCNKENSSGKGPNGDPEWAERYARFQPAV